jgi:VWFA-related protein
MRLGIASFAAGLLSALVFSQQVPRFVAGVDVVEIDVAVLGKDRKPIRGLTAADFTIREDGEPQRIVAFDEIYSPPPAPPSAPWMRDIGRDVETNGQAEHNTFVLIIDDAMSGLNMGGPKAPTAIFAWKKTMEVARRAVASLGDGDLASVVYTNDNWKGVNFTRDRSKLMASIGKMTIGPKPECSQWLGSTQSLLSTVEALSTIQHRRKTVMYITRGLDVPILGMADGCREQAQGYVYEAMRKAQAANVNVYAIDAEGLRPDAGITNPFLVYIQDISDNTGGRPIINTNDPQEKVSEILEEARAYYLIGYELSKRAVAGKFHRIEVKVNRPGAEVIHRSTRFEAVPENDSRKLAPLEASVSNFLPNADARLALSAAPFGQEDGSARVIIGLDGQWPDPSPGRPRDDLKLTVRAFTTDGRPVTSVDQSVPVRLTQEAPLTASGSPAMRGPSFSVASELALKPGDYALRVGVNSPALNVSASVYADIHVPDFKKSALSLSGMIVTDSSGSSFRGDVLQTIEPMTRRTFATDERLQGFLRVYQGGTGTPVAAAIRTRLMSDKNATVLDRSETLPASLFARDRQADFFVRLPLATLTVGEYWLSIEATAGKANVRRDLRFTIR